MKYLLCLVIFSALGIAQQAIRINSGGTTLIDPQGLVWEADRGYSGGTAFPAAQGAPEPFGTVRFGANGLGFTYTLAIPPGAYTLNLYFKEQWVTAAGARVFNIAVNGVPVLSNFDLFATFADKVAMESFNITSQGTVTIAFTTVVRSALVSAIEIIPKTISTAGCTASRIQVSNVEDLPASCGPGEIRFTPNAATSLGGWPFYACILPDTWVQLGVIAGGSGRVQVRCGPGNDGGIATVFWPCQIEFVVAK